MHPGRNGRRRDARGRTHDELDVAELEIGVDVDEPRTAIGRGQGPVIYSTLIIETMNPRTSDTISTIVIEEISLALQVATLLLIGTFLAVLYRFYARIRPLIERFTSTRGGIKIPTLKEAIGYGVMKLVEQVDFGRMLGGGPQR